MHNCLLVNVLCIHYSCQSNQQCPSDHPVRPMEILETIHIPLSGQQYNHAALSLILKSDTILLYGFDRQNRSIDIYDLNRKSFLRQIILQQEGSNEIRAATAMHVHRSDSIFLANDLNQTFLINEHGIKIKEWYFNHPIPSELIKKYQLPDIPEFTLLAYAKKGVVNLPFYYIPEEKVFLFRFIAAVGSLRNTRNLFQLYTHPVLAEVPIETAVISDFHGRFPVNYQKGEKAPIDIYPAFLAANNNILVQCQYSPKLGVNQGFKCAKSYFSHKNPRDFQNDEDLGSDGEMQAFNIDEAYTTLVNSQFNHHNYRVFQHAQKEKDADGFANLKGQASFSIMVLDSAGGTLGEIEMKRDLKADFFNVTAHPKGILIPLETEFNEKNREELYEFLLIKDPF